MQGTGVSAAELPVLYNVYITVYNTLYCVYNKMRNIVKYVKYSLVSAFQIVVIRDS